MLAAERHEKILDVLSDRGTIRTIELAEQLAVTDETIRRDLETLEKEKQLQRTHGGAVKLRAERIELPYDARKVQHIEAKQKLAQVAISLIEPHDCIYLDASSTVLQLAFQLTELPLTVITNSHLVVSTLCSKSDLKLIITGGDYDTPSQSFLGPTTLSAIQRYHIDKMFCSGNGIDAVHGISEINEWQALIKETVIKRAERLYYLADYSKLGKVSSFIFGQPKDVDVLITNPTEDQTEIDALKATGASILFAED